jgi:hypothetical protein
MSVIFALRELAFEVALDGNLLGNSMPPSGISSPKVGGISDILTISKSESESSSSEPRVLTRFLSSFGEGAAGFVAVLEGPACTDSSSDSIGPFRTPPVATGTPSGGVSAPGAFLATIPGGILALRTTSNPLPFSFVFPPNKLLNHPAAEAAGPVGSAGPVLILLLGILALSAGPRTP